MTKLKPVQNETNTLKKIILKEPKVRKVKKKLNKRRRLINKKIREIEKKKYLKSGKKDLGLNIKNSLNNSSKKISNSSLTSKNGESKVDLENISPILDVKDPKNYSANWEKLKPFVKEEDKKKAILRGNDKRPFSVKKAVKSKKEIRKEKSEAERKKMDIKSTTTKCPEIWFDVDPGILKKEASNPNEVIDVKYLQLAKTSNKNPLQNNQSITVNTKIVALDCEMVGGGLNGEDDILARVSIVDHNGSVLYDEHVKAQERVLDYRTHVSGIRPSDLKNAKNFSTVLKEVGEILKDSIIVGHALRNDFKCLLMSPPRYMVRDTSKFKPFIRLFSGGTPSLKKLTAKLLGVEIQTGEHCSIQDAQAAMRIYMLHRKEFEELYRKKLLRKKMNLRKHKSKNKVIKKSSINVVS